MPDPHDEDALATIDVTSNPASQGRIIGVDVARALAIFGMLAVHVGPTDAEGLTGRLYAAPHGRASLLFVLLAGAGVIFMARSRRRSLSTTRWTLAWRAALLLPMGLVLQGLDHGANVILQDYAVFFVLALLAIVVPTRWLLGLAIGFATIGPIIYLWFRGMFPDQFTRTAPALGDSTLEVAHRLVLSGPYPLITWAAPFLFGMWLAHRDLGSVRIQQRMVVFGATIGLGSLVLARIALFVLGTPTSPSDPRFLLTSVAHGQMPLWLVGGTAVGVAVLGIALLTGSRFPRTVKPLADVGQLALTVYVGHLLVLYAVPELATSDRVGGALTILATFAAVMLTCATLYRQRFARGPLELVLHPGWLNTRRRTGTCARSPTNNVIPPRPHDVAPRA